MRSLLRGLVLTLGLGVATLYFSGCYAGVTGQNAIIFADANIPNGAGGASGSTKEGTAECKNIMGLVFFGDCSVETAAKNGKITQIKSVDTKVFNILGFYATYTTIVKGN